MSVFESLNETTEKATNTAERYVETSKDYFKLKVFQQLTLTLSMVTKCAVIGGLVAFALIFIGLAGAIALGDRLNNLPVGLLLVGLIFVIIALVIYFLRTKINSKIISILADKFFDN